MRDGLHYLKSIDQISRGETMSIPTKRTFTASIWQEDPWYVAQCLEVDVASQGKTAEEVLDNLRAALELHFAPPVATILPAVRTIEIL